MKKIVPLIIMAALGISMSSCFVNRHTVGDGPVGKAGPTVRYSHNKQIYLFWGLVSLGQSSPVAPTDCGYQIKSAFNFFDGLATTITGGIFSMRSVKIFVNKDSRCDPAVMKLERKVDKDLMKDKNHQGN